MAALEGSKSIKIRQYNDNLAIVDERLLLRSFTVVVFHVFFIHTEIKSCLFSHEKRMFEKTERIYRKQQRMFEIGIEYG